MPKPRCQVAKLLLAISEKKISPKFTQVVSKMQLVLELELTRAPLC